MERVIDERVIEALKYAQETVVPFCEDLSDQTYLDASYHFAKLIDADYKTWKEKGKSYVVNQQTEKRLIRFYELIRDLNPSQIASLLG